MPEPVPQLTREERWQHLLTRWGRTLDRLAESDGTGNQRGNAPVSEEEDAANAATNVLIRACQHDPFRNPSGSVTCRRCGCEFAALLKPRKARPLPFPDPDDATE